MKFTFFARGKRSAPTPPVAGGANGNPEPSQPLREGSGCPTCHDTGQTLRPCRHLNCAANHPRPCTCQTGSDVISKAVNELFQN